MKNDQLPARLSPGDDAVLLRGPFTVEWDGIPVAVGHTLRQADNGGARWHDGERWHFLDDGFMAAMRVVGDTIVVLDGSGRTVMLRPVELTDAQLLIPTPQAQTLAGLLTVLRTTWPIGQMV